MYDLYDSVKGDQNSLNQLKRNPAYGKWTEDETNWSDKDSDFIQKVLEKNSKPVPTSLKKYEDSLAKSKRA